MAREDKPAAPEKYPVGAMLTSLAIVAVIVAVVVWATMESNRIYGPARQAARDLRVAEQSAVDAVRDEEIKRLSDAAQAAVERPRPTQPPPQAREQRDVRHRRMPYNDCVSHVVGVAASTGVEPVITRSATGNARTARFAFSDGALAITCHRAEGVMTLEHIPN